MDTISTRYGATCVLPFDAADETAISAELIVGRPGEAYKLRLPITLVDGVGTFILSEEETQLPLGIYYYQINVYDELGQKEIYPDNDEDTCEGCKTEFPKFIVTESLDSTEVL